MRLNFQLLLARSQPTFFCLVKTKLILTVNYDLLIFEYMSAKMGPDYIFFIILFLHVAWLRKQCTSFNFSYQLIIFIIYSFRPLISCKFFVIFKVILIYDLMVQLPQLKDKILWINLIWNFHLNVSIDWLIEILLQIITYSAIT